MRTLATAVLNIHELTPLPAQLEGGLLPALITGLSPIHRAHLAAALYLETGRPVFVVCPDETAAEGFGRDLASFTGETPVMLAGREYTFYSAEGVSRQAEQERIAALFQLARGKAPVTVCTVSGLIQRAVPRQGLEACALTLEFGENLAPERVENALLSCGYVRSELVEGPGQFARRGGIVDFFSPGAEAPVRCEFWGDELDSMGFFDPDSQRRTGTLERFTLLPAAETLISLYPGGAEGLAGALEQEAARLAKSSSAEKKKLGRSLAEDAAKLRAGVLLSAADRYAPTISPGLPTALDYIPEDALVLLSDPSRLTERAGDYLKQLSADVKALNATGALAPGPGSFCLTWSDAVARLADFPVILADAFTAGRYPLEPRSVSMVAAKQLPAYGGSFDAACEDLSALLAQNFRVVVLAADRRRGGALLELFTDRGIKAAPDWTLSKLPEPGQCVVAEGSLSAGLEYPGMKLAVLTDAQLSGKSNLRRPAKRQKAVSGRERLGSCEDLTPGDLVVHEYHGIGRFVGIFRMPVDGAEKDYIKISYAGTDSLYVPATQLDLVSKYVGAGEGTQVRLSKMGGGDWHKVKTRAKGAAKELAKGLLALYAQRQKQKGHAFAPDSAWQTEFEERFGYVETDDQLRCVREIKADMERPSPMDRLLCGDVGYGKTEVALRAVMKCVLDGKQAAILVPTTVLAQQHYQTVLQRFFGYPIKAEILSRFSTPSELKAALANIRSGTADIVVGTHRLLGKDVAFKNLGLLIVDEEQRFGVSHKEHIKEMSRQVDVLTLSATPIPRTLNMALSGLRDLSTIDEPPADRSPVQTYVMEHDWGVVCDAIRRELLRGGQVYYLHNRVENIERTAIRLRELLKTDAVTVGHGQMGEDQLSEVMERMVAGEISVLVCTTIIETGIDIPNVNTLVIEDADKLGLAQLHQIRGRVGRSSRRASAYLTFRRDKVLTETAEKRLSAIREFAEFNSGIKIAMRDLEIRGAGNLLGAEQSGHMIDVGYDMYLKLLEEAVMEERGEKPPVRTECAADLAVSANIPEGYVRASAQRMDLYRRIAQIRNEEDADDLTDELIDRFGDPPPAVNALIHVALLRGEASQAGITDISQKNGQLYFTLSDFDMEQVSALYGRPEFKGKIRVEAGKLPRVSLRLAPGGRVIEQARALVRAYAGVKQA